MRLIDADTFIDAVFADNDGYELTDRLNCYDVERYVDMQPTVACKTCILCCDRFCEVKGDYVDENEACGNWRMKWTQNYF